MKQLKLGVLIGVCGLVAGVVALAIGQAALGVLAGVLAVGAGAAGVFEARRVDDERTQALATAEKRAGEAEQLRVELRTLREQGLRQEDDLAAANATIEELSARLASGTPAAPGLVPQIGADGAGRITDAETGLFTEAFFRVALDARIASARRHLRPVAVAIIDVALGSGPDVGDRADSSIITNSIRGTLRDADTASHMEDGTFALILEDTPENGAVWTVERVRRNLVSRHGAHTLWAGVACYPAHAFSTDDLISQAAAALASAREWRQDRIEVAVAEV